MESTFQQATRLEPLGGGAFAGQIDESWYQGRGAFGGLVAALLVRAIERTAGDDGRPLRTLTVHFCAPAVAGPARIEVELVRSSSAVSHFAARIVQDDGVVVLATATRARGRDVDLAYLDRPMPAVPPPQSVAVVPMHELGAPTFARHFEYRFCLGSPPFSAASEARCGAWITHRDPGPLDAALATAYGDVLPPALFSRLTAPRPAATVAITYQFFSDLAGGAVAPVGEPVLATTRSDVLTGGYAGQDHEVWTKGGTLLLTATQLVAVIR